jgi:hypothetical protein
VLPACGVSGPRGVIAVIDEAGPGRGCVIGCGCCEVSRVGRSGALSWCSSWTNNNANQSLTNTTVTVVNGGGANGSVSFSAPSCTLHLGAIGLGSTTYVASGSVTFGATGTGSTIAYTASSDTITITLGTQQASTTLGTVPASVATFTPTSSLVGVDGNTPAAFATASTKQF